MMKTKNSVTNLLCILLISFGYVGYAQNSKPSYEWIGSYKETLLIGSKGFLPWGSVDWRTDYVRSDETFGPGGSCKSEAMKTTFYPSHMVQSYGIKSSVWKTRERHDGTYWSESWDYDVHGRKKNYKRQEGYKFFSAEVPSCEGDCELELAPLCKLKFTEYPKLFVTASGSQVGSQKWDFVFHMTTNDGGIHACTKEST